MVNKILAAIFVLFFFVATAGHAQISYPPPTIKLNGGTADTCFETDILSPLTMSVSGGQCSIDIAADSISANELGANSVGSSEITDGSVADVDINSITTRSKIPSAICYEDESNTFTTGTQDFSSSKLIHPKGTSLPGTCTEGEVFQDTDSLGTELYVCSATNTWVKVASIPGDCTGNGKVVRYTAATDAWSCGTLVAADIPAGLSLDAETFSVAATVTAGTNAQGQGALTKDINVVTTAASAPSGVTLPTATTGRNVTIVNRGANTINVYPASGAAIDGLSANAAIAVPVNRALVFNASSTTQWYTDRGGTVPILDYTTTATAAGTTTLTASSTAVQYFTGSSTQTVKLPSTATIALGSVYSIVNLSTGGAITVQSSGANTIIVVPAGTSARIRSISTTLDTAAGWDAPATLFVAAGTALGSATRKIETSTDFSPSTSNGVTTLASSSSLMHANDIIAPGQVPGNISPTPGCVKLLGAANEACFGYTGTGTNARKCWGGANFSAVCNADSECPGGSCLAATIFDQVPLRADDGIQLGVPLKVGDASSPLKSGTSSWGYDNNGSDLTTSALKPRLVNKSADRTIEKICWFTNATGASIGLRRTGPGTPVPTPALPTPSGMATPGWGAADSGCVTGQSILWPKDSVIEISYTNATGVQWSVVSLSWVLTP